MEKGFTSKIDLLCGHVSLSLLGPQSHQIKSKGLNEKSVLFTDYFVLKEKVNSQIKNMHHLCQFNNLLGILNAYEALHQMRPTFYFS